MKISKNKIASISSKFGKKVSPKNIEENLGLEKGFIENKTGIRNLYEFENHEEFFEACKNSVIDACSNSGISPTSLDGIYAAGNMTDFICPTISTRLAKKLGLENIVADSIGIGCVAGIQALKSANNQLVVDSLNGKKSFYAVVAADHISSMTNRNDYKTRSLFSDAVSTAIITNDENYKGPSIEKVETKTLSGDNLYDLHVKSPTNEHFEGAYWEMKGKSVFEFGVNSFRLAISSLGYRIDDFDYIIPHQSNLRMLEEIENRYSIKPDKLYKEGIVHNGNTSSSTVFIGLEDVLERRKPKKLSLVSFGAELSYGGVALTN